MIQLGSMHLTEGLTYTCVSLVTLCIYFYVKRNFRYPKDFPPGPRGFPIVGSLPSVIKNTPLDLMKIGEEYGGIFSFDFAAFRAVVLTDFKLIKEMLFKPEQDGRTIEKVFRLKMYEGGNHGVLFAHGRNHSEQRRYAMKTLRDFGIGRNKKSMEEMIDAGSVELIDFFKAKKEKPFKIETEFNAAIINSLWSITIGQRYPLTDSKLSHLYESITKDIETMFILFFFPWLFKLSWIPFLSKPIRNYEKNSKATLDLMKSHVEEHKQHYVDNSDKDYIDKYLTEIKNEKNPESSFFGQEGEKNLITGINDFFVAGSDTGGTAISSCVHLLAYYPDVQEKIFQQIKLTVGMSRRPCLADRISLPYLEAFIYETYRYISFVPFYFHHCVEELHFREWTLPKNTVIAINLYAVHHSKETWGDPEVFRPERFLSKDGKTAVKNENLIPFAIGRRSCLAEVLAHDSIFLFIGSLIQRFNIFPDPNLPKPKFKILVAQVNSPVPFPMIFKDRFTDI